MGYEALVRRSWKSGDFAIREAADIEGEAAARLSTSSSVAKSSVEARGRVESEMGEIAQREAAEAHSCLTVHREGIMKLAPFVKFREEKFGAVLFETRSEKVYTLSPTGAAVVREVIGGADAETLVQRLKDKYEDETGRLGTEASAFLGQLKEKGLITE